MLSKKLIKAIILLIALPIFSFSQVTTSSISGNVKDEKNNPIQGATVSATHEPSGTVYKTVSNKAGVFTLNGLRTGGPYAVKVEFVGLRTETYTDLYLSLGEPTVINAALVGKNSKTLDDVTVNSQKKKASTDRTGASTVINQAILKTLPTISRSLSDFTKLTPQANGNSFGGRDGRYNNTVVDGANLNNNFGLSTDPLPGGGANPISIDAIEEIAVNISPFDVKQGNFTGASINAITKSGTNTIHGSVYHYFRNQDNNGKKVGSITLPDPVASSSKIWGATLGGPIIKNKLFYFLSYETEERSAPGITYSPKGGSGNGNVSNTSIDSLKKFSDYLQTKYGYSTGSYDNFPNFKVKNYKFLAKLSWNINSSNKLTLKYNELNNDNDQQLNGTSIPNNPSFSVVGTSSSISRLPNSRFGPNSMSFSNSAYGFKDIVKSGALELFSNFNNKFSNQFVATLTNIQSTRTIPGGTAFPTIDIFNNNGQNYMSAGTDPFTRNNDVINDVFNITNNLMYYAGKHTLTIGGTYEYQRVGNMFMPAASSYYAFNSLNDFMSNKAPAAFSYTYSLVPSEPAVYSANLKIGQLGLYAQDEMNLSSNFKLTVGLRVDAPIYTEQPLENPNILALNLYGQDGQIKNYSTGSWPKSSLYFSPRVGFRYSLPDEKLVIRGGTGLFTGRIPFVFLTNIPSNSFMYQSSVSITSASQLSNYLFNPNPDAYRSNFSNTAGTLPSNANIVLADPNFKFPQIWRTSLGFDKNLGNDWLLTMEALYTKDINAVVMRNANQKATNGFLPSTFGDQRPRFVTTADRKAISTLGTAIVLENSSKGSSGSLTVQLTKNSRKGFYGSFAYTLSYAGEVTANPGSTASSVWNSNATTLTQNDLQLYNSQYSTPHRFIGNLSYKFDYFKHASTTISIFGELSKQGSYSYVYNGDVNNDGNSSTDLIYITRNVNFVAQTASGSNPARTAAEQSAAWNQFINNTPYLKNRVNTYAGRNEAFLPWYSRFDVKILQDLFTTIGNKKHTLQLSLDILNAGNLLNKNWGVRQITTYNNPLVFRGYDGSGNPTFNLAQLNGALVTKPWQNNLSNSSTWGLQIGIKYIF